MKRFCTYPLVFTLFILFAFTANVGAQSYCTPSYKGAGFNKTGKTTSFYTHFLEVHLADLNVVIAPPLSNPCLSYHDSTNLSTDLVRGATYSMNIQMGNGANSQYMAVWIDWDQDKIFEKSEMIVRKYDGANVGNHQINFSFTVPVNAAKGATRMRMGTRLAIDSPIFIPDPCINNTFSNDWAQDFMDFSINILSPDVQQFKSSTAYQPELSEIVEGSSNNMIMQVIVETNTNGTLNPLTAGDFKFSTTGSTNNLDISGAKLFYSGSDSRFSSASQVGTAVSYPSNYFTINAGQKLLPGTNYFWLVYDASSTALFGNILDARIYTIDVSGTRVPDTISPQGFRKIGYCPSHGEKNNFIFVYNVNFNTINNYSFPWNPGGYGNYTKIKTIVKRNNKYKLSVMSGNGANPLYTRTWIDFNGNGSFTDPGEMVLFDSLVPTPTFFTFGPVTDTVTIPKTAKVGPTRMRVASFFKPVPYLTPLNDPCINPVQIGEVEDYTVIIADDGEPVSFFKSDTACLGSATHFKDSSYTFGAYKITSWHWDFGNGDTSNVQSPNYTYGKAGTYIVSLTTNTNKPGTAATFKKSVFVNSPKADFVQYGSVFKTLVQFADQSTGGVVKTWYWDFGDPASGSNDTAYTEAPTHSFDTTGIYQVKLVITMAGGCKDSITKNVKIVKAIPPIANFSASTFNPYKTEQVDLKDLSLNAPTSWNWTYSLSKITYYNGTSSSTQNPTISFDSLSTYKVTLQVSNSAGSDTISRFFTTRSYSKPTADFTANNRILKAGQAVSFLDLSKNDPTTWLWKLGNGDSSLVQNPIYKYKNTGSYTVSLAITNPAGKDSKSKSNFITVLNNYIMCQSDASYSPLYGGEIADSGDSSDYYNFSNCGFLIKPDCAGPITLVFDSFNMDVNDYVRIYDGYDTTGIPLFTGAGYTGSTNPGSIVASTSGAMFIQEVTDGSGRAQGFRANWYAVPNIKPKAAFYSDTTGYLNSPVSFLNTTVIGVNNSYAWDYNNDGVIDDYTKDGYFTYSATGTYTVKLIVSNCKGKDSITKTIKIVKPTKVPLVDFSASTDTVVLGDSVMFYDHSLNGPTSWKWSFNPNNVLYGGTTSSTSAIPIIYFQNQGSFDVSLTSSNSIGTGATVTKKAYIYVKDMETMCNNYSTTAPFGKLYDDGGKTGNYNDKTNCFITITPCAQQLFMRFNTYDLASGDIVRLYDGTDNTTTPIATFTAGSGGSTTVYTSRSGSFYVEQITNFDGITGAGFDADWWTTPYSKPSAAFTGPDTAYTGGSPAHFDGIYPNVDAWAWDFDGDGKTDTTLQHARYQYNKKGTYKVRLVVSRCSLTDTAYKTVVVIDPTSKPTANFSADMVNANISDTIQFTDQSKNGPNKWKWAITPGAYMYAFGSDTFSQDPRVQFNSVGKYTVNLTTSNSIGQDTLTKVKYINIFSYCKPAIYNLGSQVGISRVRLGSIDNTSLVSFNSYSDYTSKYSTRLELTGRYGVRIDRLKAIQNETHKVWIDYNQNGSFDDAGELIGMVKSSTGTTWTDSFTVPKNAKQGATRMRIGTGSNLDSVASCGPNVFGEYEDYRIIIGTDITPPIIKLKGSNPASVEIGNAYIDSGATAFDAIDGDVSSKIKSTNNVDTSTLGNYTVNYTVSDSAGNKATASRKVIVTKDKTPPVLTLIGANPETIEVFYPYIELGAKAIDNRDGNVSKNVSIDTSEIDTARLGTYHAYYTAVDNSGNFSQQVKRFVVVVDTAKPVVSLIGPDSLFITVHTAYIEPGANVIDNYDHGLKATISGKVDTSKVGNNILRYNASDLSGNSANQRKRIVVVQGGSGIEQQVPADWDLAVYPIPAKDNLVVKLKMQGEQQVSLEIINALGQTIQRKEAGKILEGQWNFETSAMRAGIYFLRITSSESIYVQKVQVIK